MAKVGQGHNRLDRPEPDPVVQIERIGCPAEYPADRILLSSDSGYTDKRYGNDWCGRRKCCKSCDEEGEGGCRGCDDRIPIANILFPEALTAQSQQYAK